jgi:UPF0755 protein
MKKFAVLFLLAIVAGTTVALWPGRGPQIRIDVPEGTNPHRVADDLVAHGALRSPLPFLVWVKLRRAEQRIHIGRYQIAAGRSAFWIVDDMIAGRTQKIRVLIPEGWASWQMAERLGAEGVCDPAAFLAVVKQKKLEGFLFPATYDFEAAQLPGTVAARLKEKFDETWSSEMDVRAQEIGFTKLETVTLASIIEREVRAHEEATMVSAVYHNRLKKGMRLEADPTVQFAKGEWVSRLTYADYRNTDSPYNTYRVKGLPPGPICSPGIDSIRAALWPAQATALFFVAAEDGLHHSFSDTYRDHTNKVNQRNRLRRQQK